MSLSICPTIPIPNFPTSLPGVSCIQQTVSWNVNLCGSLSSTAVWSSSSSVAVSITLQSPTSTSTVLSTSQSSSTRKSSRTSSSSSSISVPLLSSSTTSSISSTSSAVICASGVSSSSTSYQYFQDGTFNAWYFESVAETFNQVVVHNTSGSMPPSNYYLRVPVYNGADMQFQTEIPACFNTAYEMTFWLLTEAPTNCTFQSCVGATCSAWLPIPFTSSYTAYSMYYQTSPTTLDQPGDTVEAYGEILCQTLSGYTNYFHLGGVSLEPFASYSSPAGPSPSSTSSLSTSSSSRPLTTSSSSRSSSFSSSLSSSSSSSSSSITSTTPSSRSSFSSSSSSS